MKVSAPCLFTHRSGFTLVEMSIVLVIIGLIAGGILVGRDLIRQSELRSVLTDVDHFKTAINTFRLKYNCLPGDCGNASQLGLGPDGNGDGIVKEGWCANPGDTTVAGNAELFLVWKHLASAGLISGNYTGQYGIGYNGITSLVGINVPASKIANSGYSIANIPITPTCSAYIFAADYTNSIFFGGQILWDRTGGAVLTTKEAFGMDQKIDDGSPGKGRVLTADQAWFSNFYGSPNCVTGDDGDTATYNLAMSGLACHLVFGKVF